MHLVGQSNQKARSALSASHEEETSELVRAAVHMELAQAERRIKTDWCNDRCLTGKVSKEVLAVVKQVRLWFSKVIKQFVSLRVQRCSMNR